MSPNPTSSSSPQGASSHASERSPKNSDKNSNTRLRDEIVRHGKTGEKFFAKAKKSLSPLNWPSLTAGFIANRAIGWLRDFRGFSQEKLKSMDFKEACLIGSDWRGVEWADAKFPETCWYPALGENLLLSVPANIAGASFPKADFSGADLRGVITHDSNAPRLRVNLRGADLSNADLSGHELKYLDLTGANLEGAILHNVDFNDAMISEANLKHARLKPLYYFEPPADRAHLKAIEKLANQKELNTADIKELTDKNISNLHDAVLAEGIDLKGLGLSDKNIILKRSKLKNADLSNEDLRFVSLQGAELDNVNLSNANLAGNDLSQTKISNTDLRSTNLSKTRLRYANLDNCQLTKGQLANSIIYDKADDLENSSLFKFYSKDPLTRKDIINLISHEGIKDFSDLTVAVGESLDGIDLSGVNFQNACLTGVDLGSMDFNICNFEGADLRDANLDKVKFINCNNEDLEKQLNQSIAKLLSRQNLSRDDILILCKSENQEVLGERYYKNLNGAIIIGDPQERIDLREMELTQLKLKGATLKNIDFSGNHSITFTNLENARLDNVELVNASLINSNLKNTFIVNSNLENMTCSNASLKGLKIFKSNTEGVKFNQHYYGSFHISKAPIAIETYKELESEDLAQIFIACHTDKRLRELLQGTNKKKFWTKEKLENEISKGRTDFSGIIVKPGEKLSGVFKKSKAKINLSGAILIGVTLSHCDLSGANLAGTDLRGSILTESKFNGADLSAATLTDSNLEKCEFKKAKLAKTKLNNANLKKALFENTDLRLAFLEGTWLKGVRFSNCKLNGATFDHDKELNSSLRKYFAREVLNRKDIKTLLELDQTKFHRRFNNFSNFRIEAGADLRGLNLSENEADFSYASMPRVNISSSNEDSSLEDLSKVNFKRANLKQAKLEGAKFTGNKEVDSSIAKFLSGQELNKKDVENLLFDLENHSTSACLDKDRGLSNAQVKDGEDLGNLFAGKALKLCGASLIGVKMTGNLRDTDFSEANLKDADLSDASLDDAKFKGARLKNTKLNTAANIELEDAYVYQAEKLNKNINQIDEIHQSLTPAKLKELIDNALIPELEGYIQAPEKHYHTRDQAQRRRDKISASLEQLKTFSTELNDTEKEADTIYEEALAAISTAMEALSGNDLAEVSNALNAAKENAKRAYSRVNIEELTMPKNFDQNVAPTKQAILKTMASLLMILLIIIQGSKLTSPTTKKAKKGQRKVLKSTNAVISNQKKEITSSEIKDLKQKKSLNRSEIINIIDYARKHNEKIELTHKDLKRIDLRGIDLSNVNFTGSDLTEAMLDGVNLKNANLTEVKLTRTSLKFAELHGATLDDTLFNFTNLQMANLIGVKEIESAEIENMLPEDLAGTKLSREQGYELKRLNQEGLEKFFRQKIDNNNSLEGYDLTDSDFSKIDLAYYSKEGKLNLRGARLGGATFAKNQAIQNIDFSYAKLDDTDFSSCDLKDCDFLNASLIRSKFNDSDLHRSDFTNADLEFAEFQFADISSAKFDNASLEASNLLFATVKDGSSLNPSLLRAKKLLAFTTDEIIMEHIRATAKKQLSTNSFRKYIQQVEKSRTILANTALRHKLGQKLKTQLDLARMDLRFINFQDLKEELQESSLYLHESNLSGVNLSNLKLNATLDYANLYKSLLNNTDLSNCSIQGSNFERAQIKQTKFPKQIKRSSFEYSDLNGTSFQGCEIDKVSFKGAQFTNTSFANTNLKKTNFIGAKLGNAEFSKSKHQFTNMTDANISKVKNLDLNSVFIDPYGGTNKARQGISKSEFKKLIKQKYKEIQNIGTASIEGLDLRGLSIRGPLTGINLYGCDLSYCNFEEWEAVIGFISSLKNCILRYVDAEFQVPHKNLLKGLDLRGSQLGHYFFNGCDLRGTKLKGANISGLRYDKETKGLENILKPYDQSIKRPKLTEKILAKKLITEQYLDLSFYDLTDLDLTKMLNSIRSSKKIHRASPFRSACFRGANLKNAQLHNLDLGFCDFIGSNLDGANFEKSDLELADLSYSQVKGTNFANCNLNETCFINTDTSKAKNTDFSKALLNTEGTILPNAIKKSSDLEAIIKKKRSSRKHMRFDARKPKWLDLSDTHFIRAALFEPYLSNLNLSNNTFREACITGKESKFTIEDSLFHNTDFNETRIENIIFNKGDFYKSSFEKSSLNNIKFNNCNLRESNFAYASLENISFDRRCKLQNINFKNAKLNGLALGNSILNNSNFSHAKLVGTDFQNADLSYALFANTDLKNTNLYGAILEGAYLGFADLRNNQNLKSTNLARTNLFQTQLQNANLNSSNLTRANLIFTKIDSANLKDTKLTDSYIYRSDLKNTNLKNSNLSSAHIEESNFAGANFEGADLSDARNTRTKDLKDNPLLEKLIKEAAENHGGNPFENTPSYSKNSFRNANFRNAKLIQASFKGDDFRSADLRGADLSGADLRFVDLSNANLEGANLTGAKLHSAILTGANLKNATLVDTEFFPPDQEKINLDTPEKIKSYITKLIKSSEYSNMEIKPLKIYISPNRLNKDIDIEFDANRYSKNKHYGIFLRICKVLRRKGFELSLPLEGEERKEFLSDKEKMHIKIKDTTKFFAQNKKDLPKNNNELKAYLRQLVAKAKWGGYDILPDDIKIKFLADNSIDIKFMITSNLRDYQSYKDIYGALERSGFDIGFPPKDQQSRGYDGSLMRIRISNAEKFLGANLENVNLEGANISGANLKRANLKGANLKNLKGTRGAILSGAYLKGDNLKNLNLIGANLDLAVLDGMDLSGSNLSDASFLGASLKNCKLIKTKLQNAKIDSCDISGAKFDHAILDNAAIYHATFDPKNKPSFYAASLKKAQLERENFSGVDFRYANFEKAKLQYTNFSKADLSDAVFVGTDLEETDFRGAKLSETLFHLTQNKHKAKFSKQNEVQESKTVSDKVKDLGNKIHNSIKQDSRDAMSLSALMLALMLVLGSRSNNKEKRKQDPLTLRGRANIKPLTRDDLKKLLELNKSNFSKMHIKANENEKQLKLNDLNLGERHANFADAKVHNADLSGIKDLYNVNFKGADMQGSNFSNSNLEGAEFFAADLENTNFRFADLQNADLRSSNLEGADLRGANYKDASFENARLKNTLFTNDEFLNKIIAKILCKDKLKHSELLYYLEAGYTNLRGANLSNLKLNTVLKKAKQKLKEIKALDLSQANLVGADLSNLGSLEGFNLQNANLSFAKLDGSDYKLANTRGAIFKKNWFGSRQLVEA